MKYFLMMALFSSCATYTDPEQESLTYYKCEKNQTIVIKHADDYESLMLKLGNNEQILLHHFVQENGEGYRAENYLWMTKGKRAKLMHLKDGVEEVVLGECLSQKPDPDA